MILHAENILDADGNARERPSLAVGKELISGVRLGERVLLVIAEEGFNFRVDLLDAVETRLHQVARGKLFGAQTFACFGNRQSVKHGAPFWKSYSMIFGTRNRPLALEGALRSASSFGKDGRTASSRVTLTSGTA